MKTLLILVLLMLPFSGIFAQKDSISCYFEGNTTMNIPRLDTSGGFVIHKIKIIAVKQSEHLVQDYKIRVKLDSFSTKMGDVELLTEYLFFAKETLEEDTIKTEIAIKVFNDTLDIITSFSIRLVSDSLTFNANLHTKKIALYKEEAAKVSSQSLLDEALLRVDTFKVGTIYLNKVENIPLYVNKKINIGLTDDEYDSLKQMYLDRGYPRYFANNYVVNDKLIDIQSVNIVVKEGRIKSILVKIVGKNGYYENTGPISITDFDANKFDGLKYTGNNHEYTNSYIFLNDFIDYINASDRSYFPSDKRFKLDIDSLSYPLDLISSPNAFFDARIYTDTKGLSGEENGLIQTEVSTRFIGNSNNFRNSYITPIQYVNVRLSWSKFDSKYDTLKVNSFDNRKTEDILMMTQYANTSFDISVDMLRYSRVHDGYLTVGHLMYHTGMVDTSNNFKRVFTPSFYCALGGTIYPTPRIRANFKMPVNFIYTHDQPFLDYSKKWNFTIAPEVEITLNVEKEVSKEKVSSKNSNAFLRIRYFDMPLHKGKNYWQIQTGLQFPISDLFKKDGTTP